jgi:hypothetical protein
MAKGNPLGRSVKWQRGQIEREKAQIKAELDEIATARGEPEKLAVISRRIRTLEDDTSPAGQLRRFIYVMSALVHHERKGGLSEREIANLVKIGRAILHTQGVQEKVSRLAFLHGELHLAVSQIYRKEGKQWLAAWEQQLGFYSARSDPVGGKGFQALSMANRSLRLGNGPTALALFCQVEASEPAPAIFEKARMARIQALRLMGRLDESEALAQESLGLASLSEPSRKELIWEAACRTVQRTGDLSEMASLVRPDASHREPGYLIEASILAKITPRREWLTSLPKARYLARKKDLRPQRFGVLFDCAAQLDDCYDFEVPLPVRLRGLGDVLAQTKELLSVGSELLVWAAAVRWLCRCHAHPMAMLVHDEYAALSLRLTGGATSDALGMLADLRADAWLAELDVKEAG